MSLILSNVVPALAPGVQVVESGPEEPLKQLRILDPHTKNMLQLRGFSAALLRLFDGQHTAAQVLSAAQSLQLPLNVQNLAMLVRRLQALGLVGDGSRSAVMTPRPSAPSTSGSHPPQAPRPSAPVPARPSRPLPPVASTSGSPPPPAPRPSAPAPPRPSGSHAALRLKPKTGVWAPREVWGAQTQQAFKAALQEAKAEHHEQAKAYLEALLEREPDLTDAQELLEWVNARLEGRDAPKSFGEVFQEVEAEWLAEDELDSERRRTGPARKVFAAVLVAALLALLFTPLPYVVEATWEATPVTSEPVLLERAGTVKWVAAEGQWVDEGQRLLEFADVTPGQVAAAKSRVEALQKKAADLSESRAASARARLKEVQQFLVKALADLAALREKASAATFVAPASGFVHELGVNVGDDVVRGHQICTLTSKGVVVALTFPSDTIGFEVGQQVDVPLTGAPVTLTVTELEGRVVRATYEDEQGVVPPGATGRAKVSAGRRSFVKR